jgi:hypothetical protein
MYMFRKPFLQITIFFMVVTILLLLLMAIKNQQLVLITILVGNLVLYIATMLSFHFNQKGLFNKNIQAFLRMVYSGMFLKMGICIVAVVVYAFTIKPISMLAVLFFFGLYFVYTFMEVRILMSLNKGNKDA